ncbi:MAG TPA: c-type cytochrome [Candidatus Cybelea sp.]|nr:c-type cytochrome [Candidatus Cybelea sp.]
MSTEPANRSRTRQQSPLAIRMPGRAPWGAIALGALLAASACTGAGKNAGDATVEGTVQVCSSCHGLEGRSVSPTFPRLAGQQQEYLTVQLKAFRDHTRADPHAHTYMWGMAARLTDPTIDGLAAYYSSQKPAPGSSADPAEMAAGQKIFEEGIPATEVPACKACHGEKAEGNGAFPRLAAQHRSYLESQLDAFASNARANEIMHATTKNLTPEQIRQVAAFLAAQ